MPTVASSPSTRTHSSVLLYLRLAGWLSFAINWNLPSVCGLSKSIIASLLLSLVERQRGNLRCGMFSSDVDVYGLAGNSIRCFDIAHADVFVQGGSGRAAGQCADLLAAGVDSVAAATHAAFYHLDADQFTFE